jgi:hypothetical protein
MEVERVERVESLYCRMLLHYSESSVTCHTYMTHTYGTDQSS